MWASVWKTSLLFMRMVKIEHSIFALPFAFLGMIWSAKGWPEPRIVLLLTLAMVAIRSFAMGFNRLVDLPIDRRNPRTQTRELVSGALSPSLVQIFLGVCCVIFVAVCWMLNPLCFVLSPVAILWSAFYSYAKRFTYLCHFILGSVLGLAPLAGWFAVQQSVALPPVLLAFGVTCWVAGFDILYACQDERFDREEGLYSMPSRLGIPIALALSTFAHVVAAVLFLLAGWAAQAGWIYAASSVVVGGILLFEHRLISEDDMSRVNFAFFTMNGFVAVLLFVGALADILVPTL